MLILHDGPTVVATVQMQDRKTVTESLYLNFITRDRRVELLVIIKKEQSKLQGGGYER